MKLSTNTLSILKWMSSINGAIKIDAGNKLYSKATEGITLSYVEIDEEFPSSFITTNLPKFLAMINLFDDPEIDINEDYVILSSTNGKNQSKFYQSSSACVEQPNKLPKPQDDIALKFTLNSEDLQKIMKAASVMNSSELCVHASDGVIKMSCKNKAEKSSNSFEIVVSECDPSIEKEFYFEKKYFNILTEFSYDVEIYTSYLTKFSAIDSPFTKFDIYVVCMI